MTLQDELLEQFKKQLIEAGVYDDTKGGRPQVCSWQLFVASLGSSGTTPKVCNTVFKLLSEVLGRVHPALALVTKLRTLLLQTCTSCGASCALGSTT